MQYNVLTTSLHKFPKLWYIGIARKLHLQRNLWTYHSPIRNPKIHLCMSFVKHFTCFPCNLREREREANKLKGIWCDNCHNWVLLIGCPNWSYLYVNTSEGLLCHKDPCYYSRVSHGVLFCMLFSLHITFMRGNQSKVLRAQ